MVLDIYLAIIIPYAERNISLIQSFRFFHL